jgi:hypothetical protein
MNFNDEQFENTLRRAPQPRPPTGLKERLIMKARSNSRSSVQQSPVLSGSSGNWLRRWWPALVPAGLSLVCVVVLAVQQREIRALQKSINTLSESVANAVGNSPLKRPGKAIEAPSADHHQEIAQLKETARELTSQIAALEKLRVDNQKLRAELSAPPPGLSPEETEALTKARERAERIACVNNMKQMGLAVRIWSGDSTDRFPPDVVSMSNELSTAKILICPADHERQPATDFGSFTVANCSYEWFLNPPASDADPERVLTRCPIHGNVGLCDGSVQMGLAKDHPDWLVQRDGKLYYQRPKTSPTTN